MKKKTEKWPTNIFWDEKWEFSNDNFWQDFFRSRILSHAIEYISTFQGSFGEIYQIL